MHIVCFSANPSRGLDSKIHRAYNPAMNDFDDDKRSGFWNDVREAGSGLPLIGPMLHSGPRVPVIRLSGIISDMARRPSISYARYAKLIEKAFSKKGVVAVALAINSPGGAAAQSALIAGLIRQLAEEREVPVYAFVEDVAASGGYWLACAADHIYAQDVSIVGSVGVIAASFGFEDFIERHGVHRRLHTSGDQKSFLDPFKPEQPEDVERLKAMQSDIHESFIDWVKDRRGAKLNGDHSQLFEGQFWTAREAKRNGFIDDIGDVRSIMRQRFGDDVRLIPMEPEKKLPFPLSMLKAGGDFNLSDDLIDTLESRAVRGRFGL